MMKRLAIGILLAAISTSAAAFKNEPDGFRGIKWGEDFLSHFEEFTEIESSNPLVLYHRKNENMNIGGAELSDVIYAFHNGQFYCVMIKTFGYQNKTALIEAFSQQFGVGNKPNRYLDNYFWRGRLVNMGLMCNRSSECSVTIMSMLMESKIDSENKAKARGSAKDF